MQLIVPWWTLIKIVEGQINKGYHKMIGMTPDEVWDLRQDDRRNMLEDQAVKRQQMMKRRYVRKK